MGQIQLYDGKILIVDGKIAVSEDCCCGGVTECPLDCSDCSAPDIAISGYSGSQGDCYAYGDCSDFHTSGVMTVSDTDNCYWYQSYVDMQCSGTTWTLSGLVNGCTLEWSADNTSGCPPIDESKWTEHNTNKCTGGSFTIT